MNVLGNNLKSAYSKAYGLACEKLQDKPPQSIATATGVVYDEEQHSFSINFLSESYQINASNGEVTDSKGVVVDDTVLTTLLLHYLITGTGEKLTGEHIAFTQIPGGGSIYDNAYQRRVISPFTKTFGNNLELFSKVAEKYNGRKSSYGDLSITFDIFPYVPVTYVIWRGDEEFPPSSTTMFDQTISSYLPVEDVVIMVSFSTYGLMRLAKNL